MSTYTTEEKQQLFKLVRTLLGRTSSQELNNDQLCDLLTVAIQDYTQRIQLWLLTSNWTSLYGRQMSNTDVTFSLSTRSNDYEKQFTYAVSKQAGLQQNGPYELKKDYVELEYGKQVYVIPSNREINEVLWLTPPAIDAGIYSNAINGLASTMPFANSSYSIGFNSTGAGAFGGALINSYDILARGQDFNIKNRIFRSELAYKVTAGPNGTKLLHLLSTPGSKYSFNTNYNSNFSQSGYMGVIGAYVWYYYYDVDQTQGKTPEECRLLNRDVILTPDQIEMGNIDYSQFNDSAKTFIRQLLVAESKLLLGKIRGKFSGAVSIKDAEMTLDYQMFLEDGKLEKETTFKQIDDMLEYLRPEKQLELSAQKAQNLNTSLKYTPLNPFYVR